MPQRAAPRRGAPRRLALSAVQERTRMLTRSRIGSTPPARRLAFLAPLLIGFATTAAQSLPPVTIGAGAQTSYVHTAPDGGTSTDTFPLNSVRLYVNGAATS